MVTIGDEIAKPKMPGHFKTLYVSGLLTTQTSHMDKATLKGPDRKEAC